MTNPTTDPLTGVNRADYIRRVDEREWLAQHFLDDATHVAERLGALLHTLASAPASAVADLGRLRRECGTSYAIALVAAQHASGADDSPYSRVQEMAACLIDDLVRLAARDEGEPRSHRHGRTPDETHRDVWDWASVAAQDAVLLVLLDGALAQRAAQTIEGPWQRAFDTRL